MSGGELEDRVGPKYCSFSRRGAFRPRTLTVRAEVQPWTDGNGHDKSMICPTSSNSQNLPLRKFFHSSTHRKDQLHIDLHPPRLMVVMQCFGSDKKSNKQHSCNQQSGSERRGRPAVETAVLTDKYTIAEEFLDFNARHTHKENSPFPLLVLPPNILSPISRYQTTCTTCFAFFSTPESCMNIIASSWKVFGVTTGTRLPLYCTTDTSGANQFYPPRAPRQVVRLIDG